MDGQNFQLVPAEDARKTPARTTAAASPFKIVVDPNMRAQPQARADRSNRQSRRGAGRPFCRRQARPRIVQRVYRDFRAKSEGNNGKPGGSILSSARSWLRREARRSEPATRIALEVNRGGVRCGIAPNCGPEDGNFCRASTTNGKSTWSCRGCMTNSTPRECQPSC